MIIKVQIKKLSKIEIHSYLYCNRCLNRWIRIVIHYFKVFKFESKNIFYLWIDFKFWKWSWFSRELLCDLVKMIVIDMKVSRSMDKFANFQITHLSYHMHEERIGSNIERKPEEAIDRALIELTREFIICDIELEEAVARRKRHLIGLCRIVGYYKIPAAIGIIFTSIYDFLYLIDTFAIEISPLVTINRSEFAPLFGKGSISFYFFNKDFHFLFPFWSIFRVFSSQIIFFEVCLKWPLIPNSDIIIDEIFDIRIS